MDYYVGKILDGRYEIQEVLGIGGMAVVYRAYDNIDDRPVAVKILKEEFLANEEFRRRFKNESKAIAMLSHPNIVKVYDVSYGERLQYIVMEYVEGITLKEYIEQRRVIPWKEAVHFLTQMLRALQHAHDRGVVHRDVKPQNIMLLHSGNIKVTDFGIARFSRSETRTMTENAIGSVHYISPEQARGDLTDGKSDIYSIGVVLYEMLTGQLPFQSDSTVSVAIMQLQTEPRRPRELNDGIPLGLEQITIRAMQKRPYERYQSAAEMLLDLEEFKRNPLIRFEYSYFVDKEPTRYVSPAERPRPQRPTAAPAADDGEEEAKSRLIPLMTGIAAGLVAVIAIVAVLVYYLGNPDDVIVKKFVDMQRIEIESDTSPYDADYEIMFKTEQNNSKAPGVIFKQDPQAHTKQVRGSNNKVRITLYVAEGTTQPVPDVRSKEFQEAVRMVRDAGFNPVTETKVTKSVEEGKVVETDPPHGTKLAKGEDVIIYMAIAQAIVEEIDMPDLIGWTQTEAKELLESADLKMDATVETIDSDLEEGKVAEQSIKAGVKVKVGTSITIKVSNGNAPTRDAQLQIPIPSRAGQDGVLRIYINSSKVHEDTVLLNGEYLGSVGGTGADESLEVTLDGTRIYTAKVDFTTDPPTLSEVRSLVNDHLPRVPDVTGMPEQEAINALAAAGYEKVDVRRRTNLLPFTRSGDVFSQSPKGNTATNYDTMIELTVND